MKGDPMTEPSSNTPEVSPLPPAARPVQAAVFNCGCAVLFLWVGLLSVAALLPGVVSAQVADRGEAMMRAFLGVPFFFVWVFFLANAVSWLVARRRLPGRVLFDGLAVGLAVAFHYWLFFGRATGDGSAGLPLPGGLFVEVPWHLPLDDFVLAKVGLAVLLVFLDGYLLSELWALIRFVKPKAE